MSGAVAIWKDCLKQLQVINDSPHLSEASQAAFVQVVDNWQKLQQAEPLPKATWKRLVNDMQVSSVWDPDCHS